MGQFKIEITAVGGHGCQREIRDGGTVFGCNHFGCPDCEVRNFLLKLKTFNIAQLEHATITHWPGTEGEVVDNLLTRIRTGSF